MKGIILAGGNGSRLAPLTEAITKQLLPVYDKPLIYYPISTLMLAGIREILLISSDRDQDRFRGLLGDGSKWGLSISYLVQEKPKGIADAFLLGEDFINGQNVALALGDNIFHGSGLGGQLQLNSELSGALIFGYEVSNPSEYGVVTLNQLGQPASIEEKPVNSISKLAVPGLYFYDSNVVQITKTIKPSDRNELEITAVNNEYLKLNKLKVVVLKRGTAWLDTGTPESLHDAATYVRLIEQRQGLKICCPEEIAWRKEWISNADLESLANLMPKLSSYRAYLLNLLKSGKQPQ